MQATSLRQEGLIYGFRGRTDRGINVYFSYAPTPKDMTLRDELDKQLGMLKRLGRINSWP